MDSEYCLTPRFIIIPISCEWVTSLIDTEKALDTLFDGCVEAGADRCPFYAPEPDDIRRNLNSKVYDKEPIPVHTGQAYGVVECKVLRLTIFSSLYSPYTQSLPLAQALKQLALGDG